MKNAPALCGRDVGKIQQDLPLLSGFPSDLGLISAARGFSEAQMDRRDDWGFQLVMGVPLHRWEALFQGKYPI